MFTATGPGMYFRCFSHSKSNIIPEVDDPERLVRCIDAPNESPVSIGKCIKRKRPARAETIETEMQDLKDHDSKDDGIVNKDSEIKYKERSRETTNDGRCN